HRAGQDQPEDRTGARRPEQAGRDAEQERWQHGTVALRPALTARLGEPRGARPCPIDWESGAPAAPSGRVIHAASPGTSNVRLKIASSTMAARRPYSFASTAQLPPTAASRG